MKKNTSFLGFFVAALVAFFVSSTGSASAAVIYNSIDSPLPGSYPSLGYEATSTAALGDHVSFAGTERTLTTATVTLTNWACENDFTWNGSAWVANRAGTDACVTTPGSFFTHPITLNLYAVDHTGPNPAPGALLTSKTIDAKVYYRPSYDPQSNCTVPASDVPFGGTWFSQADGSCFHGFNQNVTFDFTSDNVTLPHEVIFSVAYNTADYGANPIHAVGPYNSLNYGLSTAALAGTDVEPSTVFMNSTWGGAYCDNGTGGTGTYRRDADCWGGYVPAAKFEAVTPVTDVRVHLYKYLDGAMATGESANGVSFPMFTATYNAPFTLGPNGWTEGDMPYEASTGPMAVGSSYAAEEKLDTSLVGATCDGLHTYALAGYSVGNTLESAVEATLSMTAPSFTELAQDKYVIVRNVTCPPVATLKVHILKYLDGAKATVVPGNYQFPMTATWSAENIGAGTGAYVLGNSHGGASDVYGADTAAMSAPADYTTAEVTSGDSLVVPSLGQCAPGKYYLSGYRMSDVDFATATTATLSAVAPVFVGLTTDRYVIVENKTCPTTGSISGMKYHDLNRNGKKDLNEPGLAGWTIRLKLGKTVVTTVTGADGSYSFTDLTPGTYRVREVHQKGWKRMSKNPKPIVLIAGASVTDVNFGNAEKRRGEREDDDRDDDRDDESGNYYSGHDRNEYERDSNNKEHKSDQRKRQSKEREDRD